MLLISLGLHAYYRLKLLQCNVTKHLYSASPGQPCQNHYYLDNSNYSHCTLQKNQVKLAQTASHNVAYKHRMHTENDAI